MPGTDIGYGATRNHGSPDQRFVVSPLSAYEYALHSRYQPTTLLRSCTLPAISLRACDAVKPALTVYSCCVAQTYYSVPRRGADIGLNDDADEAQTTMCALPHYWNTGRVEHCQAGRGT
eukprot:3018781-Rhodomonas_salina.2